MAHERLSKKRSLPLLTFSVEPTTADADLAFERLADFATEHGIAPAVREQLTTVAAEIVKALAGAISGRAQLDIEADIGERDLQMVVAHDGAGGLRAAYADLRTRLDRIGAQCDRFAVRRTGVAGVEVWCCFRVL